MSSTLISFRLRSKPSTSTKAALLAPKVEIPRIQNSDSLLPGCPLVCCANTPATLPANALARLDEELWFRSSTSTLVIAPVTLILRCAPVPVTTISSSTLSSDSFIVTLTMVCSLTKILCVWNPTYEKMSRT